MAHMLCLPCVQYKEPQEQPFVLYVLCIPQRLKHSRSACSCEDYRVCLRSFPKLPLKSTVCFMFVCVCVLVADGFSLEAVWPVFRFHHS